MEESLRNLEQSLFPVLSEMAIGCSYLGFDWKFLYANGAASGHAQQKPEDMLGRSILDVDPGFAQSAVFAKFREVMEKRIPMRFEESFNFPTGEIRWFEFSVQPVSQGIFVLTLDVTERRQTETALRDSEGLYRRIVLTAAEGIWSIDAQDRTTFVNPEMAQMLGYTVDEMYGRPLTDFMDDADVPQARENVKRRKQGIVERHDFTFRRRDGSPLEASLSASPIVDADGSYLGALAMVTDVTERNRAAKELQNTLDLLQASNKSLDFEKELNQKIIETSPVGFCIYDEQGDCLSANPALARHIGATLPQVLAQNFHRIESWKRHGLDKLVEEALASNTPMSGEVRFTTTFGKDAWLSFTCCAVHSSGHRNLMVLTTDITERKQAEEVIWYQANFDSLTGLPNRQMFRDRLMHDAKQSDRSGAPMGLLLIDLDQFKEVNDTLGHDVGDVLLQEAAARILACVRKSDTVARLGGDEFTVILAELTDTGHLEDIPQKIIDKLAQPYYLGDEVAYVSASVGITLYPNDADNIDSLMKNADQAMYAAKNKGRNRFSYFTATMQQAAQARLRLTNDLRGALAANQFEVFFQPILELSTHRIHKAEALLRWQHPERGMVSPMAFIPLAEETGLINEIGDWVFKEAARWAQRWRNRFGDDFQVSVNESPKQFKAEGNIFVAAWLGHLQRLGLSGKNIVIEITEGLLLNAEPDVASRLLEFRDAGIQVAIDDFGTGYSALSYLKKFDIDFLKIDQSFVRNMTTDEDDMALCEAIVEMAHKLGLKVIAEGVETLEQHSALTAVGCDYAQGFLYSRPVPPEELEALLAAM